MHLATQALGILGDTDARSGSVTRVDRTLRWVSAGSGPTILMCAGAGETALTWAPLFADLAGRGRIIAYDRAGLGSSDPDRRSTPQDAVDDMAAILEAVGPAVVVGHSWGGLLAEVLALTRPDLVNGVVLIDPTHEDIFRAVPWRMRLAEAWMLRGIVVRHRLGRAAPIVSAMARDFADQCTTDLAAHEALVAAYEASYSSASQLATIGHENRLSGRCSGWVRPIREAHAFPEVPVVMMMAGAKPLAELSRSLNETVAPGARRHFIPDSGHYMHRDHPDAVLAALDDVVRGSRAT